jgi:hypothetical protein
MNQFQRDVLKQIKDGIDRARHEGVLVEYPRGALIDGEWVEWPFDSACYLDRPGREALQRDDMGIGAAQGQGGIAGEEG